MYGKQQQYHNNMQNIGAERFLCVWNYFMEKNHSRKKESLRKMSEKMQYRKS